MKALVIALSVIGGALAAGWWYAEYEVKRANEKYLRSK